MTYKKVYLIFQNIGNLEIPFLCSLQFKTKTVKKVPILKINYTNNIVFNNLYTLRNQNKLIINDKLRLG